MPTPPTLVAVYTNVSNAGTVRNVTGIDWLAGDKIVVKGNTEDNGTVTETNPPTNANLTLASLPGFPSNTSSQTKEYAWQGDAATSQTNQTIAGSLNSVNAGGYVVEVWRNHGGIGAVLAPASVANTQTVSRNIVTTKDHSALSCGCGDWSNAPVQAGATPYGTNPGAASNEFSNAFGASDYATYFWNHPDAGTAGSKTISVTTTAGNTINPMLWALEILPAPDPVGTNTSVVGGGSVARSTRRQLPGGQIRAGGITGGSLVKVGTKPSRLQSRLIIPPTPAVAGATLTGAAADTTSTSDTGDAIKAGARAAADTAGGSDGASATLIRVLSGAAADSAPAADSVKGVKTTSRAAADSTSTSDSAGGVRAVARAAADPTSVSDTAAGLKTKTGAAADSAPAADVTSRSVQVTRAASDTAPAADATSGLKAGQRGAADSAPATDVGGGRRSVSRAAGDSTTTSDAAAGLKTTTRSAGDVAGGSDVGSGVRAHASGVGDSAPAADSAKGVKAGQRQATDSAPGVDVATRLVNSHRAAADTGGGSDAAVGARGAIKTGTVGDAAPASDAVSRSVSVSRAAGDVAPVSDAVGSVRSGHANVGDSAGVSDAVGTVRAAQAAVADSAGVSDQATGARAVASAALDFLPALTDVASAVKGRFGIVSAFDVAGASDVAAAISYGLMPTIVGDLSAELARAAAAAAGSTSAELVRDPVAAVPGGLSASLVADD